MPKNRKLKIWMNWFKTAEPPEPEVVSMVSDLDFFYFFIFVNVELLLFIHEAILIATPI